jgi:prepilin-type N-terminal cleavage/methylation domain-containing protein
MEKGFTLIELLVAVSILAIISTLAIANFSGAQSKARDAQRKSDFKIVREALEQYKSDKGSYPVTGTTYITTATTAFTGTSGESQFTSLMTDSTLGLVTNTYLTKAPADPRNSAPMQYRYATTDAGGNSYYLETCLENNQDPAGYSTRVSPCATGNYTNYRISNP